MSTEKITKALDAIPDDFVLSQRKTGDVALNTLISEYNAMAMASSSLTEIKEESTGKDLKEAIDKLSYEERIQLIHDYLSECGRISSDADFNKKMNRFKLRFIQIAAVTILVLFVAVIAGVVTSGIYRNEINSNEITNIFMRLVNNVLNIFFGAKPAVD